jgi:hypothetical protein
MLLKSMGFGGKIPQDIIICTMASVWFGGLGADFPTNPLKIPHPIAFMGKKTIHRENFYFGVPYSQRNGADMMQI